MEYVQTPEQPRCPLLINILSILFLVASFLLFNNPDPWLHLAQPIVQPSFFPHYYGHADGALNTYGTDVPIEKEAPVEVNIKIEADELPISIST